MVMTYKNVASSLVAAAVVRVRPKLKYRNLATRPDSMLNRKDLQDVAAMVRGCKGGYILELYTNANKKPVDVLRNIGSSTGHWRYCSNKHYLWWQQQYHWWHLQWQCVRVCVCLCLWGRGIGWVCTAGYFCGDSDRYTGSCIQTQDCIAEFCQSDFAGLGVSLRAGRKYPTHKH